MPRRAWLFSAGAIGTFCACTYDWPSGSARDGGADATPAESSTVDVADVQVADSVVDVTPPDTGADAAPTCADLRATVAAKRGQAKRCPTVGPYCNAKILDECGCNSWVVDASASAVADYGAAIQALTASGCALGCTTCSSALSACILIEGGTAQACQP